jgi:uncharacterized membrane protein YheB (UPF0754 family)
MHGINQTTTNTKILTKRTSALMNLLHLFLFPVIGSLIGWATNYIAVRMLFRPRKPYRLLGFTILGLIPKRQAELAESIGETIETQLLTVDDLAGMLNTPDIHERVQTLITREIDSFVNNLAEQNPIVGMFLQGEMAEQVKSVLVSQLKSSIPSMLEEVLNGLKSKLTISSFIKAKIESLELEALEELVYRVSAHELKTIELLGGVLGFVVGCIQLVILSLLS